MSPQLYSPAAASFALRLVMQGLDAAARHENLFQEAPYALFLSWGHMKKALFFFLPTSHSGVKCVCGHIFAKFQSISHNQWSRLDSKRGTQIQSVYLQCSWKLTIYKMRMKPQISNLYLQGPLEKKKSIDELQSLFDLSLSPTREMTVFLQSREEQVSNLEFRVTD